MGRLAGFALLGLPVPLAWPLEPPLARVVRLAGLLGVLVLLAMVASLGRGERVQHPLSCHWQHQTTTNRHIDQIETLC